MRNLAFDKIVNKQNKLSSDYVPDDLVNTDENEDNFHQYMNPSLKPQISASILPFFTKMQKAAEKEGLYIIIDSGYRSYDRQNTIYYNYVQRDGKSEADTYSARPGHSEIKVVWLLI